MLESFAADVPLDLHWADELLTAFGRWAVQRRRGGRTCGSLEGNYRAPAADDDARRAPQMLGLLSGQALIVNRCLAALPGPQRVVLRVLYVPERLPVAAQLRMARVSAETCRVRHLEGLRMFANVYRREGGERHA